MITRIFTALSLNILLVLIVSPAILAQTNDPAGNLTAPQRARLQYILDPTTNLEEFRREYTVYLTELDEAFGKLAESKYVAELLANSGRNPRAEIEWAKLRLQTLTEQELSGMRTAYSKNLDWRSAPARIEMLLRPEVRELLDKLDSTRYGRAETLPGGVTADVCDNAFIGANPRISNTDISIATAAVLAASAIVDSLPDDFLSVAGKAIAVVARTVVEAVLLTLESFKNISDDCGGSRFETRVDTNLSSIKSTTSSTNSTVTNNLDVKVSSRATQSTADTINAKVDTANSKLTTIDSKVNGISNGVANINQTLEDKLDVKVSSRSTQTSVNTVQATANIINSKSDLIIAKLDALADELMRFRAENLRLQIELNLLLGPRYNHVLFQEPQAKGGHLELVREIVADTIKTAGESGLITNPGAISQATQLLAIGDNFLGVKSYKDAYANYRTAYLLVSIIPGNKQP